MLRKDVLKALKHDASTASPEEIARFSALAEEWWKPNGAFKVVHSFNRARLSLLIEELSQHFGRDPTALRPLDGLHVLDVGCGGGLVAERLACLGAKVVGIDASERSIEIARVHATHSGVNVDYRHCLPEQFVASGERFDVVLAFEVVEHVANLPLFLEICASLVANDGVLVIATLNRTLKSFLFGIVGAEHVLGLLPRGTHDWRKFVTPAELKRQIAPLGFSSTEPRGLSFNPITRRWRVTRNVGVNYIQIFTKTDQPSPREAPKSPHTLRRACFSLLVALSSLGWPMCDASARGDLTLNQDICVLKVGPDYMYFSGYQSATPRKRFCEDVPATGETIFAMDFAQDEMREMTASFRIVRDVGEAEEQTSLAAITVAYLPPKTYPTGTVSLRHAFTDRGNYAGIVTVDGPHGEHWVSRFPFAVGRLYSVRTPYYLLTAAAALALLLFFWGRRDESQSSKPPQRR
jgi:2-polyprenyl-6-hydroxyphenyl methylase / 3-demethylubiquinone-9 3-methyltransferase